MIWLMVLAAGAVEPDYDRLRDRLDEFVRVGVEQGDSIPAGWRDDDLQLMKWADATVALGWYLGVLATEQALAGRREEPWASRDADARAWELYAALNAVERIDRVAESAFPEPCTSSEELNGFFIRDDVPADYHQHFAGIEVLQSDFIDGPYLKEMSQDQVHHLDVGLALVKHLVPPDLEVEGRALAPWASELGLRILQWVAADDWSIRNPACDKLVDRGAGAGPVAPGLDGVARFLSDGEVSLSWPEAWAPIWQGQASPDNLAYFNSDNLHMSMATAAVSEGWGESTLDDLTVLAEVNGWWAYPLLHVVLYDLQSDTRVAGLTERARPLLEELGDDEPFQPLEGERAAHGWTSWHRFIRPADRHYDGEGVLAKRYWGGDWLLLNNLTALALLPPEPEQLTEGCGCRHGSGPGLWTLLLGWLALRRRGRFSPPSGPTLPPGTAGT